ncbi:MAG: VPLPA-CTERM-specific exosortase XrtD [Desulfobacca sp.]|nr:VPLPA-CTERM-specific exosortase XrtD [Desulfobacca sp.]
MSTTFKKYLTSKFNFSLVTLIAGLGLVAGLLYLYWPVLTRLIVSLAESEDYSYGLLIPLISGYIVYRKWPQIRAQAGQPSWIGLAVMALGISLYILGELAAELYTTRFSFVIVLSGLVLLVGGWRFLRLLAFPLILLVLMLPLPELITYKLTLPLQLISSRLATWFLQISGVPVFQQGNIIDLGYKQLQVVHACSGLRYILPILALGIIFCYFYQRRLWKVVVLLASLVPLAIVANALRVAAMGLYPALIEGFWHGFSGWLIFIFCLEIIALFNWLLNYLWPSPPSALAVLGTFVKNPQAYPQLNLNLYLLGGLALVLLAIPLTQRAAIAPPVALKQSFAHFPMQLGSWQGHHTYVDPAELKATKSHAHLSADFINPDHGQVNLWIAYYETQKKAGGFVHSPKGCLTASGWRLLKSGIYEITPELPVNYLLVEKMGTKLIVFYWYMQRGRWLTSEYLNKFYMAYDGFLHRRTDGALIRLSTIAHPDLKAGEERLASFAQLLAPELHKFIPD